MAAILLYSSCACPPPTLDPAVKPTPHRHRRPAAFAKRSSLGSGAILRQFPALDFPIGPRNAVDKPGMGGRCSTLAAGIATDASRPVRFEREARAAAAMNHPNITALYDIGT